MNTAKILLFLMMFGFAFCKGSQESQTNNKPTTDLEQLWKDINNLEKKGLWKSALDLLDTHFKEIVSSGNPDYLGDAMIRGWGYHTYLHGQQNTSSIKWMITKLELLSGNAKAVVYSIVAEKVEHYFLQNAWRIRDRSYDPDSRPVEMVDWSARDLLEYADTLYSHSLNAPEPSERLTNYEKLITWDKNAKDYDPSVMYFLLDRVLQFYVKDHQIAFAKINQTVVEKEALMDQQTFLNWAISGKGKYYEALKLYQTLLKHSEQNENQLLRLKTNLNRLEYAWSKSARPDRKELFEKSLTDLIDKHRSTELFPEVAFYAANYYLSFDRDPDQPTQKKYVTLAKQICEEALDNHPGKTSHNCEILLNRIIQPVHQIQVEEVNPSGLPFRASVSHKNIEALTNRLFKIDHEMWAAWESLETSERKKWLESQEVLKSWEQPIKDQQDYIEHRVEIKIDPLEVGTYILASQSNETDAQYVIFHISNLAAMSRQGDDGSAVYVVDRMTGLPRNQVLVQLFVSDFNNRSRRGRWIKAKEGYTDQDGKYSIQGNDHRFYRVKLIDQADSLFLNEGVYQRGGNRRYQPQPFTHLFTDRSIYRPGQIVFFKGIGMQQDADNLPQYLKNQPVTVELIDPNGESITSLNLRTNEYGSMHGQFPIPQGLLKGRYSLRSSLGNNTLAITVEEYKRPKFEVTFDTLDQPYVLDELVSIQGKATSLVNTVIEGARLKYTITQQPVYLPYHGHFQRFIQNTPKLVKQGIGSTDQNGAFSFSFTPISDPAIRTNRNFQAYNISVEITDKNGETRTISEVFRFDQQGRYLDILGSNTMLKGDLYPLTIKYRTTQGDPLVGRVQWSLARLNAQYASLRGRLWQAPDQWVLEEASFRRAFPHDPYKNENEIKEWKIDSLIIDGQSLDVDDQIPLDLPVGLDFGAYRLTVSQDEIEKIFYFKIIGEGSGLPVSRHEIVVRQAAQPAETIDYFLNLQDQARSLVEISSRQGNKVAWNSRGTKALKIVEADRGGLVIKSQQIFLNRFYAHSQRVDIPWTNKALNIELISFRSLLEPGQEESWKVRVLDHLGVPAKGELTSTLYDAALDYFVPHQWRGEWYPAFYEQTYFQASGFKAINSTYIGKYPKATNLALRGWFWLRSSMQTGRPSPMMRNAKSAEVSVLSSTVMAEGAQQDEVIEQESEESISSPPKTKKLPPQIRKNLQETVFFIPGKELDDRGEVTLDFKMNEALTTWRWKLFVHDQQVAYGYHEKEVITKKEVMVFPNFPRIIREGDLISLPVKVVNASDLSQNVEVSLELFDPLTNETISSIMGIHQTQNLTLAANKSGSVQWQLTVPGIYKYPIGYRVIANAASHSDGEEGLIPVLSRQVFLTETLPITVQMHEEKELDFKAFSEKFDVDGIISHNYSVEITENPLWLVVKALPLLLDDLHPNAISAVNRYFATSIVKTIYETHPSIARVIADWADSGSLESPLFKNEELKNILLQETPWVTEANTESLQMKRLLALENPNMIQMALRNAIQQLMNFQNSDGGFSWCNGSRSNLYVTLYILDQFRKLESKGIGDQNGKPNAYLPAIQKAIKFVDQEVIIIFNQAQKAKNKTDRVPPLLLKYLLARLHWSKIEPINPELKKVIDHYQTIAYDHWVEHNLHSQIKIASLAHHNHNLTIRDDIIKSLREMATTDATLGTYWPTQVGYLWNARPLEIQADIIELYKLSGQSVTLIESCKTWLLRNKQTQQWRVNTSIASAVYALLDSTAVLKATSRLVNVFLGNKNISPSDPVEAGTGYWKQSFRPEQMEPDFGKININNPNDHTLWGSAYFQFFQDASQVKSFNETGLKVDKQIYYTTADGSVIGLDKHQLNIGDRVRVVLNIRSDRMYEFVHLRDLRGAGLEPTETLSRYVYKGGLGYYQSPSDQGQDFYFDRLRAGSYTIEYDAFVAQAGNYSMGVAKIQCLYAPEYTGHSAGSKLKVEDKIVH